MSNYEVEKAAIAFSRLKVVNYDIADFANNICIPERYANKYSRGYCGVVAGDRYYPGAAMLACQAAEKSGAGYTQLFTDQKNVKNLAYELKTIPVSNFREISKSLNREGHRGIVVGCGFVPFHSVQNDICQKILKHSQCDVIVDGGALSSLVFKKMRKIIAERHHKGLETVLTPHAGEAYIIAKAVGIVDNKEQFQSISSDKMCFLLSFKLGCIVVLKGPDTYICDSEKIYCCKFGTPALAKAGSGDVLAGVLGGIICQCKLPIFEACVTGSYIHALAGKLAQNRLSIVSVTANDVANFLPIAFNLLLQNNSKN